MEENSLVEYGSRRAIVTITAILCALLEIVDTTIVNVALNDMKGNLGATLSEIGWVVTAYAIGNVIIIPLTSWLAQQFGRRDYFAVSVLLFTLFSFFCGNATSLTELFVFRFFQGIGGGALLVTSQTIITESYPQEKRGMAQAFYGLGIIVGPTLGPPLGGYIVDHYTWPFIFYINIPLGILAALLTLKYVRSPKYNEKTALSEVDFLGIAFLAMTVGSLQFVLERGQEKDWFNSGLILFFAVLAGLSCYFFIWREMTIKNPIVNLRILKDSNLRIGTILTFILGFGLFGSTFIIPLYLQNNLGWTAEQAGLIMIPSSLTTACMMPIIGGLLQKGIKHKYIAAGGMFLFFVYSIWGHHILTPSTGTMDFFWMLMLRGLALSMLFIPVTTLALSNLKGQGIGQGASFTGITRQLGGSFGIAFITTFMSRKIMTHRSDLLGYINPENIEFQERFHGLLEKFSTSGMAPNIAQKAAMQAVDGTLMAQASILSYMDVFLLIGIVFLVCVPFVLMIREEKTQK